MAEKRYTCNCNGKTRKCYHPCSRGCCPNGKDIGSSRGTLNEIQTNNQLNSLNDRDFSILGGVVAPKRSAYVIQGMRNPLTEKQNGALDTTRPSVRDNSSVTRARF